CESDARVDQPTRSPWSRGTALRKHSIYEHAVLLPTFGAPVVHEVLEMRKRFALRHGPPMAARKCFVREVNNRCGPEGQPGFPQQLHAFGVMLFDRIDAAA